MSEVRQPQRRTVLQRVALLLLGLALLASAGAQRTLTIAQTVDIPGFDPHNHGLTAVEAVITNVFDYLLFRDANGDIQPALATGYEQVDDLTWRFTLRDDVLWHDGQPFTAADVKFSLERVARDESLFEHDSFQQIAEVEIVNDHEVLIHTSGPDPVLLNRVSRKGADIVPAHVIEAVGWEGFSVNPVGTGPFRFVEWVRDDRVVLEAFPDHWRGAPVWDRLVFRAVPEDATRVGELLTGNVDIAVNFPSQDVARVRAANGADVISQPTTRIMMLLFNTADGKATADPRVREAIELAIDKELLVEVVADGFGVPVAARVSPGVDMAPMKYYDQNAYDPERAVELLAEAGYGPGDLTIALQGPAGRYPGDADTLAVVQVMLNDIGVNTTLESLEWSAYNSRIWGADNVENIALIGLANSLFDGWFALRALPCDGSYAKRTNWCNPEFDQLLTDAEFNLDLDERARQIEAAYDIVAEERPMIALFQIDALVGVSNAIEWQPRPDEMIWAFDIQPK